MHLTQSQSARLDHIIETSPNAKVVAWVDGGPLIRHPNGRLTHIPLTTSDRENKANELTREVAAVISEYPIPRAGTLPDRGQGLQ